MEGALPQEILVAGVIAAALLAGVGLLAESTRTRAGAMVAALVITPVVLVAEIWNAPQVEGLREDPALTGALALGGLIAVAGLALLISGRPWLLAGLAAFTLPFRIPVEAGGATANLLVPLYLVIGAGALAWAVPRLREDRDEDEQKPRWLERLLVVSVVLYAVQTIYSSDVSKALEQVVFFYVPFVLLFALLRELEWTPRLLGRCFAVLVSLALVFAAVGFWEYGARELLLNPKVIASNQFEEYFRVNSLFFDPNIYGRFLAVVMLGLASMLLWARGSREVGAATVGLVVLWGGLVLTLSQSSFVSLLAGLAVLAALRFNWRWTAAAIAVGLVVAVGLIVAFPGAVGFDSDKTLDEATSGRASLIEGGVGLAASRPLRGYGSGSFSREFRKRERTSSARAVSASHTIPITVAAEQGIVGLAVYLALLAVALVRLLPGAGASPWRAWPAAAFVALVVHTWMYAAFLEDPMTWALLGVGTALAPRRP